LGERANLGLVIHHQDRALGRQVGRCVNRLRHPAAGVDYPPVNLPTGQGERCSLDLEDHRRSLDRDPSVREQAVNLSSARESAAPVRVWLTAQRNAPDWQEIAPPHTLWLASALHTSS